MKYNSTVVLQFVCTYINVDEKLGFKTLHNKLELRRIWCYTYPLVYVV